METVENKILNGYLKLLEKLSPNLKLNLIEKLTKSIRSQLTEEPKIKSSFGAWKSVETAEELIDELQLSRNTKRQIENL